VHLAVPCVGVEWPAMRERHDRACAAHAWEAWEALKSHG
jgi:hypothetical protein